MQTLVKTKTGVYTKIFIATCLIVGIGAVAYSFMAPAGIEIPQCDGKLGDINKDGFINYQDEALLKDMIVGNTPPDACAYMDGDPYVGPGDLVAFRRIMFSQGCVDTDGGANFDEEGTVTVNGNFYNTDSCVDDSILEEHICQNNKPYTIHKKCNNFDYPVVGDSHCINGACTPIDDHSEAGELKNSHQYDTCVESDGGIDLFNYSQLNINGEFRGQDDTCSNSNLQGIPTTEVGTYITESFCRSSADKSIVEAYSVLEPFKCPNGCKDGACIPLNINDTRTYTCPPKPYGDSTVWNNVGSYTQTWNGTAWLPKDDLETEYNITGVNKACRYKCRAGQTWNGSSCTTETFSFKLNANSPTGLKAPETSQDMIYIDITNDSYLNQEVLTLAFKLKASPNFKVNSCLVQDRNTQTIYGPSMKPDKYLNFIYYSYDFHLPVAPLSTITVKLVCDTTGTMSNTSVQAILYTAQGQQNPINATFPINGNVITY